MALPLSPSTTYVSGTTPSIKAADLNDLQTYLSALASGTLSVKSLVADGTGGNVVSPLAGTLAASGSRLAPNATVIGTIYKELVPCAWGHFTYAASNLTCVRGVNFITSAITQSGTGQYTIPFVTSMTTLNYAVFVTAYDTLGESVSSNNHQVGTFDIIIKSAAGAAFDCGVDILVFG